MLAVSEIFGPTIQGEGPFVGTPTMFLRLAGCNLACSWCDTPYSWDWKNYNRREEVTQLGIEDVYDKLCETLPLKRLVITGGEPMLQQSKLFGLTKILRGQGWFIEIETAGTIIPITTELVDHYNVSPKLSNSGNDLSKRYNPDALDLFMSARNKAFKFVVEDVEDFNEIDLLVATHNLDPVYIMPEGISSSVLNARATLIVDAVIERGYRLTPRLHVDLFGNKRGV